MCNVGVSLHFRFCHRPHTLLEPPMVNIILYVAMLHQGGELGELVLAFDKVQAIEIDSFPPFCHAPGTWAVVGS